MPTAGYPAQSDATPPVTVDSFISSPVLDQANFDESGANSLIVPLFDGGAPCGDVVVENPETKSDMTGMNKFTTFNVRGSLSGVLFASRKRYSDFVWFRATLAKQLPGVFLPALPGKQNVGRFDATFIEERRGGLQQFLRRIFQREEICTGLPLITLFLTCTQADMEKLKAETDSRPIETLFHDYQTVFAELLANSSPPKTDKGFLMVKTFLDKHIPLLKAAQVSVVALQKEQDVITSKMTDVGRALAQLCDDETELLEKAGKDSVELRAGLLMGLHQNIQCEKNGQATHTLNASLQREIEDCESALEGLASIELLQQRLRASRNKIASSNASLAHLKGEAPEPSPDESFADMTASESLAGGMRKRDKAMALFGKMTSAVVDISAKTGMNKEKRIAELDETIGKDTQESFVLEAQIDAARTVFSATEITMFLEVKTASCLWAQSQFSVQKAALYQELAGCWSNPA